MVIYGLGLWGQRIPYKKMSVLNSVSRSVVMKLPLSCVTQNRKVFLGTIHSSRIKSRDPFLRCVIVLGKKQSYHVCSVVKKSFFTSPKARRSKRQSNRSFFPAPGSRHHYIFTTCLQFYFDDRIVTTRLV